MLCTKYSRAELCTILHKTYDEQYRHSLFLVNIFVTLHSPVTKVWPTRERDTIDSNNLTSKCSLIDLLRFLIKMLLVHMSACFSHCVNQFNVLPAATTLAS